MIKKVAQISTLFAAAILMAASLSAQNNSVDGLALMKVEHSARAAGMGGAYVTQIASSDAAVYNPASAAGVVGFSVALGHTSYWENIRIESGFFVGRLNPKWVIHGGIRFAGVDDLQARRSPTTIPDAIFEARDISFKSGLAYAATDKLSLGFAFGWFLEKIEAWRGSAFNLDLGAHYLLNERTQLGASITNLGSSFQLTKQGHVSSRDITLPTTYRLGGKYAWSRYTAVSDLVIVDDDLHLHVGAEAHMHKIFDLRAGYMAGYDTKNFTAGVSFIHDVVTVDYGFVPYTRNLGTSHLFSLTFHI